MRRVLFWIHLTAGSAAGLVILMMSVTGVLLTYERQIIAWAESNVRSTAGTNRLPPEELIQKVRKSGQAVPGSITLRSGATDPVEIAFGRDRILYVDAYSGSVLGRPAQKTRAFFHEITEWHRWFAAQGTSRATARAFTGACKYGIPVPGDFRAVPVATPALDLAARQACCVLPQRAQR